MRHRKISTGLVLVGAIAWAASCVKNPVTGKPELSLVSKSDEVAIGKQAADEVLQSIGPYPDPQLQAYVSDLGQRLAKITERPDLPWAFHVVDDPAVNAFALPGGQIFLTRGILAYLTSEAELAAVTGHECGHVAAKHSVEMISKAELAELGLGIGSVFVPGVQKFGSAIGAGLQLLFLRYSRDNENQADELGFRYTYMLGYDARSMRDLFTMLDAVGKREGGGRLPEWLATHPSPENRLERVEEMLAAVRNVNWDKRLLGRDNYLRRIDGLVYGDDRREGYFQNNTFVHPELAFRIDFPQGWKAQNTRERVIAVSGERDAAMELGLVAKLSPDQAFREFFSSPDVREVSVSGAAVNTNGQARYFQARAENGTVGGLVSFFSFSNRTFQFVAYSDLQRLASYDQTFRRALSSFGQVTDPRLLAVQVARIQLATVPGDMTLQEFQRRYPSIVPIEELALLNGTPPDRPLSPGQLVKKVVGGPGKSATRQ